MVVVIGYVRWFLPCDRATACPMVKVSGEWGDASECDKGDRCSYCHTRMELQFHPDVSLRVGFYLYCCSVVFLSRPWSEGWSHHGRTFSIYLCPLSFRLILPRGVLSTYWCCPSRPCVVFLACVHLPLFLALSLSPCFLILLKRVLKNW